MVNKLDKLKNASVFDSHLVHYIYDITDLEL